MTATTNEKKMDAELFLLKQLSKLTPDQKEKLSYVLYGATMGSKIIGPKATQS